MYVYSKKLDTNIWATSFFAENCDRIIESWFQKAFKNGLTLAFLVI
jgi:hypothetical protein